MLAVLCVRGLAAPVPPQRSGKEAVVVDDTSLTVHNDLGSPSTHRFDVVMGPDAGQATVFEHVKGLVDSALAGYNATLFAYGQTVRGGSQPCLVSLAPALWDRVRACAGM
jgi:hypothetical protein